MEDDAEQRWEHVIEARKLETTSFEIFIRYTALATAGALVLALTTLASGKFPNVDWDRAVRGVGDIACSAVFAVCLCAFHYCAAYNFRLTCKRALDGSYNARKALSEVGRSDYTLGVAVVIVWTFAMLLLVAGGFSLLKALGHP